MDALFKAREELVTLHGEDMVRLAEEESARCKEGPTTAGLLFDWGGTKEEIKDAYRRGKASGACPIFELPDFYTNHWDVFSLCDMFPCPGCFDDSVLPGPEDLSPYDPGEPDECELNIPF